MVLNKIPDEPRNSFFHMEVADQCCRISAWPDCLEKTWLLMATSVDYDFEELNDPGYGIDEISRDSGRYISTE